MSTNVMIKSFEALTEQECTALYSFSKDFQSEGFYATEIHMTETFGGPLYGHGSHHLSLWEGDSPLASVGWIDRELEKDHMLFLSHGFSSVLGLSYWELLLECIRSRITEEHPGWTNEIVEWRFGLRGGDRNVLLGWLVAQQWKPRFEYLVMTKSFSEQEGPGVLQLTPLSRGNWQVFLDIHNAGFESVHNGMLYTADEFDAIMDAYKEDKGYVWILEDLNRPVGIAMLKFKENQAIVELDALAISPALHGQGYGRLAIETICAAVVQSNPEISAIELIVASTNEKACKLYHKTGFVQNRVEVQWFDKHFKVLELANM